MTHPAKLITTDIGELWVTEGDDLGMEKDGTFLEAKAEMEYMKKYIRPGINFIDVGAHVGFFSIYAAQLGASYVHAFEPSLTNFRLLAKNYKLHNINGLCWNYAVADEVGYESLHLSKINSGDHMLRNGGPTHELGIDKVYTVTLDSTLSAPQFIKIDVQGSEYRVLKGFEKTISRWAPIIMMEYSPWHLEAQGEKPHAFLDYLGTLPYNLSCDKDPYKLPSPAYTTLYLEPK